MNKTQNTILRLFLVATVALAAFAFTGCATSQPIKTTLDLTTEPAPSLNYSSEKDVVYSRTVTDPETGVVEQVSFQALASAAAYAQAERDKVQAEANAAQAEALRAAVQALRSGAVQVLSPAPVTPITNLERARAGLPLIPATP